MASNSRSLRGKAWETVANAVGYTEFDPLNRINLGRSVETALLSRPLTPLSEVSPFWGAGIYAIYFEGSNEHDPYGKLAESAVPVYVGRAIPRGARKGLVEVEEGRRSKSLWMRIDEHRESIEQAKNLELQDFRCRWLVADMLFVPMAERLIIQTYRPLWNVIIDGFGNHDPGSGRYYQERSPWDTLHHGRSWAPRLAPSSVTEAELRRRISAYFQDHPPDRAPTLPPLVDVRFVEAAPPENELVFQLIRALS